MWNLDTLKFLNYIFGLIMKVAEIRKTVSDLAVAITKHENAESKKTELYQFIIQNPKILSKPNLYRTIFSSDINKVVKAALMEVNNIPEDKISEYADIFQDYHYYSNNIETLCKDFEGIACCADKSRVLIGRYLKYLISGVPGEWEVDDPDCYWLPRFGTQNQWMDLIHGLWLLRRGFPQTYLAAYKEIFVAGLNSH